MSTLPVVCKSLHGWTLSEEELGESRGASVWTKKNSPFSLLYFCAFAQAPSSNRLLPISTGVGPSKLLQRTAASDGYRSSVIVDSVASVDARARRELLDTHTRFFDLQTILVRDFPSRIFRQFVSAVKDFSYPSLISVWRYSPSAAFLFPIAHCPVCPSLILDASSR